MLRPSFEMIRELFGDQIIRLGQRACQMMSAVSSHAISAARETGKTVAAYFRVGSAAASSAACSGPCFGFVVGEDHGAQHGGSSKTKWKTLSDGEASAGSSTRP
jgi:hypothetical protein